MFLSNCHKARTGGASVGAAERCVDGLSRVFKVFINVSICSYRLANCLGVRRISCAPNRSRSRLSLLTSSPARMVCLIAFKTLGWPMIAIGLDDNTRSEMVI